MAKNILGVVIGYIAMAAFVFLTFTATYLMMGADGAYEPGSYEVSSMWILSSLVLGTIAAILGGFLCQVISKNAKASMTLAGIVLVLGIAMAISALTQNIGALVRTGDVGAMEAMQSAHQPNWVSFLNPLIGALGVIVGSRMRKSASV